MSSLIVMEDKDVQAVYRLKIGVFRSDPRGNNSDRY